MTWNSNVTPRFFGKGRDTPKDWLCKACYNLNKKWFKKCIWCGVEKSLSDQIKDQDEVV